MLLVSELALVRLNVDVKSLHMHYQEKVNANYEQSVERHRKNQREKKENVRL